MHAPARTLLGDIPLSQGSSAKLDDGGAAGNLSGKSDGSDRATPQHSSGGNAQEANASHQQNTVLLLPKPVDQADPGDPYYRYWGSQSFEDRSREEELESRKKYPEYWKARDSMRPFIPSDREEDTDTPAERIKQKLIRREMERLWAEQNKRGRMYPPGLDLERSTWREAEFNLFPFLGTSVELKHAPPPMVGDNIPWYVQWFGPEGYLWTIAAAAGARAKSPLVVNLHLPGGRPAPTPPTKTSPPHGPLYKPPPREPAPKPSPKGDVPKPPPGVQLPPVAKMGSAKDILDRLPGKSGKTGPIKLVPDQKALEDLFNKLSQGGKTMNPGTYPGVVKRLPDGTIIRMRDWSKMTHDATIDITLPNGRRIKVHIQP